MTDIQKKIITGQLQKVETSWLDQLALADRTDARTSSNQFRYSLLWLTQLILWKAFLHFSLHSSVYSKIRIVWNWKITWKNHVFWIICHLIITWSKPDRRAKIKTKTNTNTKTMTNTCHELWPSVKLLTFQTVVNLHSWQSLWPDN